MPPGSDEAEEFAKVKEVVGRAGEVGRRGDMFEDVFASSAWSLVLLIDASTQVTSWVIAKGKSVVERKKQRPGQSSPATGRRGKRRTDRCEKRKWKGMQQVRETGTRDASTGTVAGNHLQVGGAARPDEATTLWYIVKVPYLVADGIQLVPGKPVLDNAEDLRA
ncbi:hypothetical protein ACRALDRAFT_212741 [Sodiomyces alcalophilus JCM 7366]|uniref:uncharacterized protein n=1 Tax=Sodiomyces alcalophilus JCM 7366 TaxID=591952 RepID=UPI0039B3967D